MRIGSLILPDPDTYFTEDSRLKDGRTALLLVTKLLLTRPVLYTANALNVSSERREIVHSKELKYNQFVLVAAQ